MVVFRWNAYQICRLFGAKKKGRNARSLKAIEIIFFRMAHSCFGSPTVDAFLSEIFFTDPLVGEGTHECDAHLPLLTWQNCHMIDGSLSRFVLGDHHYKRLMARHTR